MIVNLSDPSECYVLFPSTVSIEDIFNLNEKSSWVGAPMLLTIRQPSSSAFKLVTRLIEHKPLEEGEKYELIPIEPEEEGVLKAHSPIQTQRKRLSH